jgi:hypothetical protein
MKNQSLKKIIIFLLFIGSTCCAANVDLLVSEITHKRTKSTGSVEANWKIDLRNNTERKLRGQLWVCGYDKDGFECYKNLYEVLTTLQPNEERKLYHELWFDVGQYQKCATFKFEMKGF